MEARGVPLVLGIDLGTSSVKVALLGADTGDVITSCCKETHAQTTNDLCPEGSGQGRSESVG